MHASPISTIAGVHVRAYVGSCEHLKDMLVGNILAVSWAEVGETAALYGAAGLFHFIFLFYGSFGFVVTSSVAIAGVLLVFCCLIVPSVGAMLFAESIGKRLAIGWTMGTAVSALGVYLSLVLDLPTGPAIVCTFGVMLALMATVRVMLPSRVVAVA